MGGGKPAGVRCIQLTDDNLCRIFGRDDRPSVCSSLRPGAEMCGKNVGEALELLAELERNTRPVSA
jgi:hypothetical protein